MWKDEEEEIAQVLNNDFFIDGNDEANSKVTKKKTFFSLLLI